MASKLAILIVVVLLLAAPVAAVDHRNLEENHPTRIEDAYPITYRSYEIQSRIGYQNESEFGNHAGEMENEFKWGFMKNAHMVLGVPLIFSDQGDTGNNGDVRLEGLYNINVETQTLPAFAVKVDLLFPTGRDSQGVDSELIGIATKGWGQSRFHLNTIYKHNSGRQLTERQHLYSIGMAFDHPIDLDHLFTADFFADRSDQLGQDGPIYSFVVGGRKQINPWSVLTFGGGHAFGQPQAADFIFTLGFQINF